MAGPRGLPAIEVFLRTECAIWTRERRSGDHCGPAVDAAARIDVLLDERLSAMALRDLRGAPGGAEPGAPVRTEAR